jgi:mannitol-1-phosphate 5-dehydrogenase
MNQKSSTSGIIVFGAGAAGKGLIGLLFSQAGYDVTFVDIKDGLVKQLRDVGHYKVLIHNLDGKQKECSVKGFNVLHAHDREHIAQKMVHTDLVLTAVFAQNLPDVAKTIAMGVSQCRNAGRSNPVNCIACENMKNSSSTLKHHVHALLSPDDRRYSDEMFAFPDCMINRVVPNPSDALALETEDYCEWTVDADRVKGAMPIPIPFIEFVHNQSARLDRKLMVYNGSHAACAYFGFARGHTWIHEALTDEQVVSLVCSTIDELSAVVQHLHGFSRENIEAYKRDFWLRCRNRGLKDKVVRIARQPKRKLGRRERLIGPAKLAMQYQLPHSYILQAIWAALTFRHPDDPESMDLAEQLRCKGLRATLSEVSELEINDPLFDELEEIAPY